MATPEIIKRAREIIRAEPTAGKNRVNRLLQMEFGVGLRSATVLKLKEEIARQTPSLRYELYARGSVKVSLREAYFRLRDAHFYPWEAREFAERYKEADFRNLSYIKKMVSWRRRYVNNLRYRGFSDREIADRVNGIYRKRDWLTADGYPSVWKMLKAFRQRDIDSGEYIPEKRVFRDADGNIRKIIISKGDVRAQKARYRERLRERLAGDEAEREKHREQRRQQKIRARAREEH